MSEFYSSFQICDWFLIILNIEKVIKEKVTHEQFCPGYYIYRVSQKSEPGFDKSYLQNGWTDFIEIFHRVIRTYYKQVLKI